MFTNLSKDREGGSNILDFLNKIFDKEFSYLDANNPEVYPKSAINQILQKNGFRDIASRSRIGEIESRFILCSVNPVELSSEGLENIIRPTVQDSSSVNSRKEILLKIPFDTISLSHFPVTELDNQLAKRINNFKLNNPRFSMILEEDNLQIEDVLGISPSSGRLVLLYPSIAIIRE